VRALGSSVEGSEVRGALEHHVLEVVREAGAVGRIVATAGSDRDPGGDARLLGVDAEVDGEAVF
jgi:cell division FtsZ-interacting protein ZapD